LGRDAGISANGDSTLWGESFSFAHEGKTSITQFVRDGNTSIASLAPTPDHTVLPTSGQSLVQSFTDSHDPDPYDVSGILDELTMTRPARLPNSFQKFEDRAAELCQCAARQPLSFDHQSRHQVSLSAVRALRSFYAENAALIDRSINIQVGITPDNLSYYRSRFLLVLCENLVSSCSTNVRAWIEREYKRFFSSLPVTEQKRIYAPVVDGLRPLPTHLYHPSFSPDVDVFETEYYSSIRSLISSKLVLLSDDSIYARTSLAQSTISTASEASAMRPPNLSSVISDTTRIFTEEMSSSALAGAGSSAPSATPAAAAPADPADLVGMQPVPNGLPSELSKSHGYTTPGRSVSYSADLTPAKAFELLQRGQSLKKEARNASKLLKSNQEDRQVEALVKVLLSPEFECAQRIEVPRLKKRLQQVLIGELVNIRSVLARAMAKYRWLSYADVKGGTSVAGGKPSVVSVDRLMMRLGL